MADFENTTRFGARAIPSSDREGRDLLLIVVAAAFSLPRPSAKDGDLQPSETQEPPPLADEYMGEPAHSSLRLEGQSAYTRPATDIYVRGHACAPNAKPVREMGVTVKVGPCSTELRVFGDRTWQRAVVGARPSQPAPFLRVPIVWERAYGGVAASSTEKRPAFEARNPVGCGLETNPTDALDKPVPNIEDPRQLIGRLSDRPEPSGLAPIARYWQPRAGYIGTYDEAWRRERAPNWPKDFDERFFCAAPPRLQAHPHLVGGEPVLLEGLHPAGRIAFRLPKLRFMARSRFVDRVVRSTPVLDGILIDTDALRLTMYFRSSVAAPLSLVKHRETLLRHPEGWETVPAQ